MTFDQSAFDNYLLELRSHLFADKLIEEIIEEIQDNHQARRYVAMYFMKDKPTFHSFYAKRKDIGVEFIFDTVISALFAERHKKAAKQELIDMLEIDEGMIDTKIEGYAIKEFDKDFNAFWFWNHKREGTVEQIVKRDRDVRGYS